VCIALCTTVALYTILHGTDLIIFHLTLQTIITAPIRLFEAGGYCRQTYHIHRQTDPVVDRHRHTYIPQVGTGNVIVMQDGKHRQQKYKLNRSLGVNTKPTPKRG